LFGSTLVLLVVRGFTRDLPFLFSIFAGGLLLLEVFVHLRHIRNLTSFWHLSRGEGVSGQLSYERWFSYRASSIDALSFAIFLAVVAVLGGSWFFAGGAASCFGISLRQGLRSRQLRKASTSAPITPSETKSDI
jgi:hypothetical protein